MSESKRKKGLFSNTLTKLKSALSKTKSTLVESAVGDDSAGLSEEEIARLRAQSSETTGAGSTTAGAESPQDSGTSPEAITGAGADSRSTSESAASTPSLSSPVTETAAPAGSESDEPLGGNASEVIGHEGGKPLVQLSTGEAFKIDYSDEKKGFWKAFIDGAGSAEKKNKAKSPATPVVIEEKPERKREGSLITVDDEYLEDLEEKLIKADIGVANVEDLVTSLRTSSRGQTLTPEQIVEFLRKEFLRILQAAPNANLSYQPGKVNIYLVVGVNGTGKTTSIGKMCWRFKQEGKRVLMAAGDTFRAAAESQLEIWSRRADVDIVRLPDGSDPGAVVFKAVDKARAEHYDCLVIDTAGRLHNKSNLMAELKKIRGVIDKHAPECPLECLLVLDASTGQNGIQQAKVFTEACSLTGVVLTKLDGSAKGGVIFSIARDLEIPVKLIGLGEQMDDLKDFDAEQFVSALL